MRVFWVPKPFWVSRMVWRPRPFVEHHELAGQNPIFQVSKPNFATSSLRWWLSWGHHGAWKANHLWPPAPVLFKLQLSTVNEPPKSGMLDELDVHSAIISREYLHQPNIRSKNWMSSCRHSMMMSFFPYFSGWKSMKLSKTGATPGPS